LALFIGAVPKFLGIGKIIFSPVGLCATTVISLIILYIGIRRYDIFMGKDV